MKNIFSFFAFILALATAASAQTVVNVSGDITSSTTWTNDKIYTLGNVVYVNDGVTLTINAGTIIKGTTGSALVIMRGAKIVAQGSAAQPIVFTSNKASGARTRGDWGGLIICGRARTNDVNGSRQSEGGIDPTKGTYGGTNDADNSGVLNYVRVEFAGYGFQPDSELNGISFNAVGSGTQVSHVQSSFANDDAFEWFGGTVNGKFLIAHRALDDDFDADYGFTGKVQFGLVIRDSSVADVSGSNAFESDNDANGSSNTPFTSPVFSNVTVLGPRVRGAQAINSNYKRALHLRRSTKCSVFNSVFSGYATGLKVEGTTTATHYQNGELMFANNLFAFTTNLLDSTTSGTNPPLSMNMANLFNSRGNTRLTGLSDLGLVAPNYTAPNLLPTVNSILLSGASFASAKLNDPFFTATTYRGAFGTTDWTSCWAEFNPVNADYTTAINYFPQTVAITEGTTAIQATPGYSYRWSTGETTQSIVKPNSGAGQYSVTVTNARGCSKTTSIVLSNENTDAPSIRLTPNPASGTLYVSLRNLENTGISVRIIDMTGRQLISENNVNASNGLMAFDITSLHTGIYQVVLTQGNNTITEKLIVQ